MADDREKTEALFSAWLAQNIPSAHLSELRPYYAEIETYCLKAKILSKPLLETTDLAVIKKAYKKISENRWFQLSHRKQMKKILSAAQCYMGFVKALDAGKCNFETSEPENIQQVSFLPTEESSPTVLPENEGTSSAPTCITAEKSAPAKAGTKDPVIDYLKEKKLKFFDLRDKLGCLWIVGDYETKNLLRPLIDAGVKLNFKEGGGNATGGKSAWWTKDHTSHVQLAGKPSIAATPTSKKKAGDIPLKTFLKGDVYRPLYRALTESGITTLAQLKEINLWSFMNQHRLYTIQQRLTISTELTTKLRGDGEEEGQDASAYEILYNGRSYKGASPSEAFMAFLPAIAAKYPLKFRKLLDLAHPETGRIVLSRYDGHTRLRLMNPDAYVDPDLSPAQVKMYIAWIIERCDAMPKEYSVKQKSTDVTAENPPTSTGTTIQNPRKAAKQPNKAPERKVFSPPNLVLMQEAENYLRQCDLTGATYEELQDKLRHTMVGTKEIVAQCPHIIEMNRRLYHEDALVDFEEGADALEAILDKLLKKNNGIATAKHLYEYARNEMAMFFNDNDIEEQQAVYDLARHLFEKLGYHGKRYAFKSNMYISLPDVSADSVIDIVKKYAREKGSTVTIQEVGDYLTGLGMNTGNLRGLMQIDKKPVFLIYAENEYLLAELMHINKAFFEEVRGALKRLFADCGGHIIPRNISDSWYKLLPALPASLPWTPILLQQLIRFYPSKLEARTIIAMETQSSNTLHAMFVEKESWIQDFRDVVEVFLHDEMPDRDEFGAEELRKILVDAGMIGGGELTSRMHIALSGDQRFIWDGDGSHVKVRI